jgi:hypothetical protein
VLGRTEPLIYASDADVRSSTGPAFALRCSRHHPLAKGTSVGRLMRVLNSPWVSGLGSGAVVALLTSGFVAKLDRTTLALAALLGVLVGLLVGLAVQNRLLASEISTLTAQPAFDAASGFFYERSDLGHDFPLCPGCMGKGRTMALIQGDYGWQCPTNECQFFRSFEDAPDRSAAAQHAGLSSRSL